MVRQGMTYGAKIRGIWNHQKGSSLARYKDNITPLRDHVLTPHYILHGIGFALRYRVPEFRSAKVNVVNAEQVHILDMP